MSYKKASFGVRFLAFILDTLILSIVIIFLGVSIGRFGFNIFLLAAFITVSFYNTILIWRFGATAGKKILKLMVVTTKYEKVGFSHAFLREVVGKFFSRLFFFLGYLWVLNDRERQALHDKIARTYVVKLSNEHNLIAEDKRKIHLVGRLVFSLIAIFVCISISLGIFYAVFFKPLRIAGNSMLPTYKNGAVVGVKHTRAFKRGDVIAYSLIVKGKKYDIVKRLIAFQGDKISFSDGTVYVNGKKFEESYLPVGTKTLPGQALKSGFLYTVPKNYVFLLGDNRATSIDSRAIGFIPAHAILGKVAFCLLSCK